MFNIEKLARKSILKRNEYVPGKPAEEVKRELGLEDIVKLASNENPLGASPLALEAVFAELKENASRYPEGMCHDLVLKLAKHFGVSPSNIMIENGLDGMITLIGMTFIDPGDEVIYGELSFPAYENITDKMAGIRVAVPMTEDFRIDVKGIIEAINENTKVIFLCNPNNPTGTTISKEEFEFLRKSLPDTVLLIMDEAYYEFVDDPKFPQTLDYLQAMPNLIILRTFSKIMGLAGLRVGYAIAHPEIIKLLAKAREPFPVNRAAQAGALASLDDHDFMNKVLTLTQEGRKQYYDCFKELGLTYSESQTNFVFVNLGCSAKLVFEAMLRDGVIVRPLSSSFGMDSFMRISIGTSEENKRAITALKRALASCK